MAGITSRQGRTSLRRPALALAGAAAVLVLTACVAGPAPTATPQPAPPRPSPSVDPTAVAVPPPVAPVGEVTTIAQDLDAPWSVVRLPRGGVLVSECDTALVVEILGDGSTRIAGEVAGVDAYGEGGLLGIADHTDDDGSEWLYAYFSAADDNRIVRMPLTGAPGELALGAQEDVLIGIPRASNHNGGRIAFGPDGLLYATSGDAGNADAAQDPGSLSGKILRMTPGGDVPPENTTGTLVYSIGHRNPQGIAWDSYGRLWASEFGQNTWDELNLIEQGANYGWPLVEGAASEPGFVDPLAQWATADASPSGLAIVSDTLFLASLRGERMWAIYPGTISAAVETSPWFIGEFGRLRDVIPGPDGTLWFLTNNTDGRGSPTEGDDRLLQVQVGTLAGG